MAGPGYGKKRIGKADVYIHEKGKSNARITHVDIELSELNKIIKPGEATYVQGKEGGVFIGLKKEMIKKAESLLSLAKRAKLSEPQKHGVSEEKKEPLGRKKLNLKDGKKEKTQ